MSPGEDQKGTASSIMEMRNIIDVVIEGYSLYLSINMAMCL